MISRVARWVWRRGEALAGRVPGVLVPSWRRLQKGS